jgi:anti-sigma regulatory factor (Ser/Thr protein kinase)/biotin operon repressor
METRERIVAILKRRGGLSGAGIAADLGISRQAAHRHLRRLVDQGVLQKTGRTRDAVYRLTSRKRAEAAPPAVFRRTYPTEGLQEDLVFAEVDRRLALGKSVSPNAHRILTYAFTEMLNNAIEHSHAEECAVEATLGPREVIVIIRDRGVGVFRSVADRYRLRAEEDSVGELLKGKATSMPERHSGQGIFFTSKACDRLELRSHRIELVFDTRGHDVVVNVRRALVGTAVTMAVSRSARRKLAEVFSEFAPEAYDLQFEKTRVLVRLAARDYVSRSEARRLVARLEQFREAELDFSKVTSLGQGFADEIFRVFARAYPSVKLTRSNVAPALDAVIRSVVDENPVREQGRRAGAC